jgi:uncharacterized membrane protein
MGWLTMTVVIATLLCSLVAGFLFAFAVVVMPGLARLDDVAYLRGFQTIDGVIQRNQPIFVLTWLGSVVVLVLAAGAGVVSLDGWRRGLLISAAILYVLGVQLPTMAVNIPRNNRVKVLDLAELDGEQAREERRHFEPTWTAANLVRTLVSIVVVVMLLMLLAGLPLDA